MHLLNVIKVALRPAARYAPTFEYYHGKPDFNGDDWYVRERSFNGQTTGTGGEGFASKWNAKRAAYAKAARTEGATVKFVESGSGDSA